MTNFTPQEQMLLEMANRARLDPTTEAANDGITLNQYIDQSKSGTISADPKQVLAGSNTLHDVALNHSKAIVNSHILETTNRYDPHGDPNDAAAGLANAGDGTALGRVTAAGFTMNPTTAYHPENFAWQWTTPGPATDAMTIQAGNALFKDDPANMSGAETGGHRLALLDPNIKEMGVGEVTTPMTPFGQTQSGNAVVIVENFGNDTTNSFLTGAVYNDAPGPNGAAPDRFYSIGEGVQGVVATVKTLSGAVVGSDVTGSGGGWSVSEPGGTYVVTFSGGGLAAPVSAQVEGGNLNAKVDLVSGHEIDTSANTTLLDGATGLRLLGIGNINGTGNAGNNVIVGNAGNNILTGGGGNDAIDGGGGDDTAVFSGNRANYQITVNGATATLTDLRAGAPDGTDTITNIEHVKFADVTVNYGDLTTTAAPPPPPPPPAGSISISNATITEGNSGSHVETFIVTRTGGSAAFDVNFATSDGTATVADGDYVAASGPLHFAAGINQQSISVIVNGDTRVEADETYNVTLSGATNGATIAQAHGIGTIVNDDFAGSVSISDATITEGNSGTQLETFTVTRTGGSAAFDVSFATHAGTASAADGDYVGASGLVHFADGAMKQTISIVVNGDTKVEADETYNVTLSGATNGATISHATGVGTILNDDVAPHAAHDFNGDGMSDILLSNTKNGSLALWELNGNHIISNTTVGSVASGWHVDGIGDFGGDGKADILLHSDSGQVAMWQMNGDHIASNTTFATIGTDWHVAGIADFNGGGKADILWQNSQGQLAMWQMDGNHIASNTSVGTVGADWHIAGTADFNGDGKADILLESSKGQVAMWQMNGDHIASNTTVGSIGTDWHVAGTADFGGDGKADILWQSSKGQVAMWQMNGDHIASNTTVASAPGWSVTGTGDVNHDGKADVMLEDGKGNVAQWQMNGDHVTANQSVGSHPVDWHMV